MNRYFWNGRNNQSLYDVSHDTLTGDIHNLYLSYYATNDIDQDEEILLDYGKNWELRWNKYIEMKKAYKILRGYLPIFRYPIEAPSHMFPAQWYTSYY